MNNSGLAVESDFAFLLSLLPDGWQDKAKELGALRRCRKIPNAEALLRVLLIHLAEGCSLRETALRARSGGIVDLSDVAIMDRLRGAGAWFRWMSAGLMESWIAGSSRSVFGDQWNVRLIDATRIKEPGPTGSSWTVHYSIGLPSLSCDELIVCDKSESGESFVRFGAQAGDLMVGDRVYGARRGIFHVTKAGGDVLVRFPFGNLPLENPDGTRFDLLRRLRALTGRKIGDWPVVLSGEGRSAAGRICAIKKSRQAAEKARRHLIRKSQKDGSKPKDETLEATGYVFVFTTVPRRALCSGKVLEVYRGRWQIELVFKRMKSILGLGHLRKTDKEAAVAWIEGKLFVAFLIEALIRCGESFFPWGYPLRESPLH